MSGEAQRILLDTNAVVALLRGHSEVISLCATAAWLGVSIITELEFLAFPKLTAADRKLFLAFLQHVEVVNLSHNNQELLKAIIRIRRNRSLKLPDAIVLASAHQSKASLLTADQQLANFPDVITFDPIQEASA